ncbi:MAG: hypothetical protein ABIO29_01770 [Sphingomicrobium sp.]
MSRPFVLILFVLLVAGAAYFLSTLPKEVPVTPVSVDVAQPPNAN